MQRWSLLGIACALVWAGQAGADSRCVVPFDDNGDCRIDIGDFAKFAVCMAGPGNGTHPLCGCQDADVDGVVDMRDFAALQVAFTGDALIPGCDLSQQPYEPGPQSRPLAAAGLEPVRTAPELGSPMIPELVGFHASEKSSDDTWPVFFAGERIHTSVDMRIVGRGLDFVWGRTYRSRTGPDTPQGVGWDHSYNVWIEASGGDLVLHDGNGRVDTYGAVVDASGTTWCAPEFFRVFHQDPNSSYVCQFAQGGTWRFHPLDGTPREGNLLWISDTNNNQIRLNYNNAGDLINVVDTLGRTMTVGYDGNGRVASVTDFTGRQVTYDYYTAAEAGGSAGDLKSVTTPVVTGTPTGNDFPTGKTTTYTYTKGFSDPALNHNLLTITDPKGQVYSVTTYAQTQNPNDLDYDRVVQQQLGDVNDRIDYVYESVAAGASNGYAVVRTTVNNRNGHVREYLYDKFNRCVEMRVLTGQANPNQPTSSVANRPTGKRRPSDPNAFVSTFRYNYDGLLVEHIDPEASTRLHIYAGDVDLLSPSRARGNLLEERCVAGPRGGDQQQLVETYEYDALLNGDTNRVTRAVDARGNATTHVYDASGNRVQTTHRLPSIVEDFGYNSFGQCTLHIHPDNGSGHRRRDEFTYHQNGPQRGYLFQEIRDATGTALTTAYEYDPVGNPTRVIDPKGNDSIRIYNALNQVVREVSRSPGANLARYEMDTIYDENENVVRVDVQNVDENGVLQTNQHFSTTSLYDILDHVLRTTEEVDPNNDIVTEYEYDGERNRTLVRSGEATNGNQTSNTVATQYDERDLVYQTVRGTGSSDQSTTQLDYDGNGNCVTTTSGLEDGLPRVQTHVFDGYDRLVSSTDPQGNVTTLHYDANGNETSRRLDGELQDVPGGASNVRLLETVTQYDVMDRESLIQQSYFDCDTQVAIGSGLIETLMTYSDSSQVLTVTDDNGHVSSYSYDTMNRPLQHTDAGNNLITFAYDDNSNVISETETARSDLGVADEVFVTTHVYDGLDRRISSTDSSGNTHTSGYDSRGNLTVQTDSLSNEVRYVYDGLNRQVLHITDMDGDGADGDGDDITMDQVWDDNSRCVTRIDDNGNATQYAYDSLDRCVQKLYADGTSDAYQYDVHGNCVLHVDANGSSTTSSYDANDRLTQRNIVVGAGVSNDTTFELFSYDGMNRFTSAQDDDAVLSYAWNSMSNPVRETLNGDATLATYDGVGNRTQLIYPSGDVVDYTYDALDRVSQVLDGNTPIATYDYVGSDRVTRQVYRNGVETSYVYDGVQGVPNPPLDAGVKQVVSITHSTAIETVDQRTFAWDAMHNKVEQRDVRTGGPGSRWAYDYDDAYRLTFELLEDNFGLPLRLVDYDLDGPGNRLQTSGFGLQTGPYFMDPASPPSDAQVNQYTATPLDTRSYDDNGNLSQIVNGPVTTIYEYDYANRLVAWEDLLRRERVEYDYDPAGRRIAKGHGGAGCRYRYAMSSDVIEEFDPNGNPGNSYVYGTRQGGIVCVKNGMLVFYQQRDDLGSVVALTDSSGSVVERYAYNEFGIPSIFDPNGLPLSKSAYDVIYLFGGMRRDAETGWYLNGSQYLDPVNGRYVTRPKCMWDSSNRGNATQFMSGNPLSNPMAHIKRPGRGPGGDRIWPQPGYAVPSVADGGGHVTVLKAAGGGHGHVTVLKAAGGGHGHVTVLKVAGGGGGHVTVLKARGGGNGDTSYSTGGGGGRITLVAGGGGGHVTVLKASHGGGGGSYKGGGGGCGRSADGGGGGHVTVLKARGGGGGHVTVLKAAGNGDSGCGPAGRLGKVRRARGGGDKCHEAKCDPAGLVQGGGGGHVTVLKRSGQVMGHGSGPGCVCLTAPCLCGAGGVFDPDGNGGCTPELNILHLLNTSGGGGSIHFPDLETVGGVASVARPFGGGGSRARHGPKCPCANCGPCLTHGKTPRWFCKGDHTNILPAANNISSR